MPERQWNETKQSLKETNRKSITLALRIAFGTDPFPAWYVLSTFCPTLLPSVGFSRKDFDSLALHLRNDPGGTSE